MDFKTGLIGTGVLAMIVVIAIAHTWGADYIQTRFGYKSVTIYQITLFLAWAFLLISFVSGVLS